MSLSSEIKRTVNNFSSHVDALKALLKKHEVDGVRALVRAYRQDDNFREAWNSTWAGVAKDNGGKLSITAIGVILGAALGGVGIAALGGAIGLPLALVLGLGGLVAGTEMDAVRRDRQNSITVSLAPDEIENLKARAADLDVDPAELATQMIVHCLSNQSAIDDDHE